MARAAMAQAGRRSAALNLSGAAGPQRPRALRRRGARCAAADAGTETVDVERWNSVEPKRFAVGSNDQIPALVGGSVGAFLLRGGTGALAAGWKAEMVEDDPSQYSITRLPGGKMLKETMGTYARPAEMLQIYEFESCPYCRKVRELVNYLDLDATFYPVTDRSGAEDAWRAKAQVVADEYGLEGRQRFPLLEDPGAKVAMYESDDIIAYLMKNYGGGEDVPLMLRLGPVTTITAGLASLARGGAGGGYNAPASARKAEQPIDFYGYEPSPFSKVVRERLCELGLAHNWYTTPRGSPTRQMMWDKTGTFQAPYIEDPNTGVKMFESTQIIEYLNETYA